MVESCGMKSAKIGIVDDEAGMRDALVALLTENHFDPVPMESSADFLVIRKSVDFDLVLIDLQLKDESGLALAMDIRSKGDLPIVMLTGRGDETDKIVGLEVGADDYLLKPFNPRELIARIRAVLRRYGKGTNAPMGLPANDQNIALGALVVDRTLKIVSRRDGGEVPLANAEYRLLDFFLDRPNQIIPRVDLLAEIGSDLTRYMDRTIDVLILRLRRKIEETRLSLFIFRHAGAKAISLSLRVRDQSAKLFQFADCARQALGGLDAFGGCCVVSECGDMVCIAAG